MIILLSSAKTMSRTSPIKAPALTTPRFNKDATEIALHMTQFSTEELASILKISPKLAADTYHRFQEFHSEDNKALQAILAYTGVVFKNMKLKDFTEEEFYFAQEHLRFVSVCYGLLSPFDAIKSYRLEYDVKLPELGDGNMYNFWRSRQTATFIKDIQKDDGILLNLASMDIQPSFDWKEIEKKVRVITPEFKLWKNGKLDTIVIYTKMARGQMSRHIIKHQISDPEEVKTFSWEGYRYNEELSTTNKWTFVQE